MSKRLDLVGQKFNKLQVIEFAAPPSTVKNQNSSWFLCKCDCGRYTTVRGAELKNNGIKSCGCLTAEINNHNDQKITEMKSAARVFKQNYSDGDLTLEQFYNLSQQNCYYCNIPSNMSSNCYNKFAMNGTRVSQFAIDNGNFIYNGLDRIDSNIGHFLSNVVSCCIICNKFKHDISINEFITNINNLKYCPTFKTANELTFVSNILIEFNIDIKNCSKRLPKPINGISKFSARRSSIIRKAISRGLVFNLSKLQCSELMCAPCNYCGRLFDPSINYYNGIDRIDNNIGYILSNSVSCCKYCNFAKNNMTIESFILWIKRIKDYLPELQYKINHDERFINEI
jgi:hypothetical protein